MASSGVAQQHGTLEADAVADPALDLKEWQARSPTSRRDLDEGDQASSQLPVEDSKCAQIQQQMPNRHQSHSDSDF